MLITKKIFVYQLFILFMAISYLPPYFNNKEISIVFGDIDIYLVDICVLTICLIFLFSLIEKHIVKKIYINKKNEIRISLILFSLLYLWILIKFLIQSPLNTSNIRIWLNFSAGYLFVLFCPFFIESLNDLRRFIYTGTLFAIYITILHSYKFAIHGYQLHVLSGNFLTLLGTLYFIITAGRKLLRINILFAYLVKISIITTYVMVGHRSGFIAFALGMMFLIFLSEKKKLLQQLIVLSAFSITGLLVMILLAPALKTKLTYRMSTTFDTQQETYQSRYDNIFTTIEYSKEYPVLGRPFDTDKISNYNSIPIVPHNLICEWLYFYGLPGMLICVLNLIASYKMIKKFLMKHHNQESYYQIGIGILCACVHNLFFAMCNVTSMSIYNIFCLYLPLVILISLDHNIISCEEEQDISYKVL